jgi:hypothetical protein
MTFIESMLFRGLEALLFQSARISSVIIPGWGGKIASLVDRRTGRQWLHTNPLIPYRLPAYGADYTRDFDAGGFDECFPNIAPGRYPQQPWQGVTLPDHGEVWALPWQIEFSATTLRLSVAGRQLPYRLEKWLSFPAEDCLRLDYRLENLSPYPLSFIWSSHPTLAVMPGMRIVLPAERLRVDSASERFNMQAGREVAWPWQAGHDLSLLPPREAGWAAKFYTRGLAGGWAVLSDPSNQAALRFEFDPELVTHIGLWMNFGGWTGVFGAEPYYNLAIEPCIGVADRLVTAMEEGEYGVIPPGGVSAWWLNLVVN